MASFWLGSFAAINRHHLAISSTPYSLNRKMKKPLPCKQKKKKREEIINKQNNVVKVQEK